MLPLLRKALPFLAVAVFLGAAYDAVVFYSRWRAARETEQSSEEKKAEEARHTLDRMGGSEFRILNFYASPAVIHRGQKANICYGVFGAKSVRMEPAAEELHPAMTYCSQVSPSKTTEYKLVAEDGAGHTAAQSFVLEVRP